MCFRSCVCRLSLLKLVNCEWETLFQSILWCSIRCSFLLCSCVTSDARNRNIFETIYFGACEASMELARNCGPYESYYGSPASKGQLQFDLWGVEPTLWDWDSLGQRIAKHGLRNSLLVAAMPTASTAQILGNSESIDPVMSNMYIRRYVIMGESSVVHFYL